MCGCPFNHGDLTVQEYVARAGHHKDAEVFAILKKSLIEGYAHSIVALNGLSVPAIVKLCTAEGRKDQKEAIQTAQCIQIIQSTEALSDLMNIYYSQLMGKEFSKEMPEPIGQLIRSLLE